MICSCQSRKLVIPFQEEFEFNRPKKVDLKNLPFEEGIYDLNEGDKGAYERTQKKIYKQDPLLYNKIWKFKRGVGNIAPGTSFGASPEHLRNSKLARVSSSLPMLGHVYSKNAPSSKISAQVSNNNTSSKASKLAMTSYRRSQKCGKGLSVLENMKFSEPTNLNKNCKRNKNLFGSFTTKPKQSTVDYQAMKSNYNQFLDPKYIKSQSLEAKSPFRNAKLGDLKQCKRNNAAMRYYSTKKIENKEKLYKPYKVGKELLKNQRKRKNRLSASSTVKDTKQLEYLSPEAQPSLNDLKIRAPNFESLLILKTGDFLKSFTHKRKFFKTNKTNVSLKKSAKILIPLEVIAQRNRVKKSINRERFPSSKVNEPHKYVKIPKQGHQLLNPNSDLGHFIP
ncbi:unnamed protein product [Moneuplotes crassus]|uniref:Uncharacterized protein n=1 Tax=Euplotes crassus TaxID=5936 RepID=A0AAD1Y6G0_EUPCR|nr:unnamed protein product [Moneuplotes crassus]